MKNKALQDELKVLQEENASLTSKLKRIAQICKDINQEKEGLKRKLNEKEDEVKGLNEKIEVLEKKLEYSYSAVESNDITQNNEFDTRNKTKLGVPTNTNYRASRLRYSLSNAGALLGSNNNLLQVDNKNQPNKLNIVDSKQATENVNVNIIALQSKRPDTQITYLLKKLREDLEEKNRQINVLNDENAYLRMKYEEEKSKELANYEFVLSKISKHNVDTEFIKATKELSSIKSALGISEYKNQELMREKEELYINIKQMEDLLVEYKQQLDIFRRSGTNIVSKVNAKEPAFEESKINTKLHPNNALERILVSDYYKILNFYRQMACILQHTLKDYKKAKYFLSKSQQDNDLLNEELVMTKNQVSELESMKERQEIQIKGNNSELEYLRDKNKELKSIIDEMQLSKKTYNVTYYYLGIAYEGKIIFEKSEEDYFFKIITKMSTRKLNLADYEFYQSGTDCLKIKNRLDNSEEDYYTQEVTSCMADFELFKKKYVEMGKFKTLGSKVISEKPEKEQKDLKNKEKKLKDVFGF